MLPAAPRNAEAVSCTGEATGLAACALTWAGSANAHSHSIVIHQQRILRSFNDGSTTPVAQPRMQPRSKRLSYFSGQFFALTPAIKPARSNVELMGSFF